MLEHSKPYGPSDRIIQRPGGIPYEYRLILKRKKQKKKLPEAVERREKLGGV